MLNNLSAKMHAQIQWDEKTRMIALVDSENKLVISLDSNQFKFNNKVIKMANKPLVIHDTTYLPLRVIVEAIGGNLVWDEKAAQFTITLK